MNKNRRILILGAGLAGLSLSYFLKEKGIRNTVFEKDSAYGGLCRSRKIGGFTFDISGHLLHFRNEKSLPLIRKILGDNLAKHKRNAYIYAFGKLIPYPFQVNFYRLPEKISNECLLGFLKAKNNVEADINDEDFLSWSYRKFGRGITDYFMKPYNHKFWKMPLKELCYKGVSRFVFVPKIGDIEHSIAGKNHKSFGYSAYFWYPKTGGINELIEGLARGMKNIYLDRKAMKINLRDKTVKFNNGVKEKFDMLISTIPLPELGKILEGVNQGIRGEFSKLRWLSIINMSFSVDRKIYPGAHWIYFPDKNTPFFRVGFFHNFSSSLTPSRGGAIYAEASYSKSIPLDKKSIVTKTRNYLIKTGIIQDDSKIICRGIDDVKYAYPVYDISYNNARSRILKFLSGSNIITCGRFGSWKYMSMEDVILESRGVSDSLCNKF